MNSDFKLWIDNEAFAHNLFSYHIYVYSQKSDTTQDIFRLNDIKKTHRKHDKNYMVIKTIYLIPFTMQLTNSN